MTLSDIKTAVKNDVYMVKVDRLAKLPFYPDSHVFDENKSVRWNADKVKTENQRIREAKQAVQEKRMQKKRQFLDDIASAVQMEHDFTVNQSKIVAAQAWEEGHSNGLYEVIAQAQIIADFCETFLKAGHE